MAFAGWTRRRAGAKETGRSWWAAGMTLGVALFLGGCSADPGGSGAVEIPELTAEVDLRIDGYESDLVDISWLGVSPTGDLVLTQPQDHSVRFFDASGSDLGTVGREGEGPGEFGRPARGGWMGDTLWISDTQLDRITVISPRREVSRAFEPLPVARPDPARTTAFPTYARLTQYAVYGGDTLLVTALGVVDGAPLDPRRGWPLLRVTADGLIQREVARIPSSDDSYVTVEVAENQFVVGNIPFHPLPDWTVSRDGSRVAMLTLDMGEEDFTYRVRVFDAMGEVVVDRTFAFEPTPIPGSVLDSAIAARVARREPGVRAEVAGKIRDASPAFYPPADRILLGSDDRIWIGLRPQGDEKPWLILAPDGEPLARVRLGAGFSLHAANSTHVWGVERDELGVQSVIRYRIY